MMTATSKHCGKCERDLPIESYWTNTRSADGLQAWCKECLAEAHGKARVTAAVLDNVRDLSVYRAMAQARTELVLAEQKGRSTARLGLPATLCTEPHPQRRAAWLAGWMAERKEIDARWEAAHRMTEET
jgi:ribosome modulation factor